VRIPLLKHTSEYLSKGTLNRCQNFAIKLIGSPSRPGADFLFASVTALSSSEISRGASNANSSASDSLLLLTSGFAIISGPRNF
jgi:hypothetical protein